MTSSCGSHRPPILGGPKNRTADRPTGSIPLRWGWEGVVLAMEKRLIIEPYHKQCHKRETYLPCLARWSVFTTSPRGLLGYGVGGRNSYALDTTRAPRVHTSRPTPSSNLRAFRSLYPLPILSSPATLNSKSFTTPAQAQQLQSPGIDHVVPVCNAWIYSGGSCLNFDSYMLRTCTSTALSAG